MGAEEGKGDLQARVAVNKRAISQAHSLQWRRQCASFFVHIAYTLKYCEHVTLNGSVTSLSALKDLVDSYAAYKKKALRSMKEMSMLSSTLYVQVQQVKSFQTWPSL